MTSTRVFWWSGVFGIGLIELLANVGWLGWVPVLGSFVQRGGPAGEVATIVLGTTIWVLLLLITLNRRVARERRLTRYAWLPAADRADAVPADHPDLARSRYHARLAILRQHTVPGYRDAAEYLLSARAAVDDARAETPYGPIRALVWALPALGFVGTAAEMSSSIGGVGAAVARTASYGDLRDFLAQNVIPPLASAFGITLFALTCSVVCHVLVSITRAREERFAVEVDDWTLDQLAERMPPDTADQVIHLNGDVDRLSREVAAWRQAVARHAADTAQQDGELSAQLAGISDQLVDIRDGLDRDLVVRRAIR
jgi:hypothetical protein